LSLERPLPEIIAVDDALRALVGHDLDALEFRRKIAAVAAFARTGSEHDACVAGTASAAKVRTWIEAARANGLGGIVEVAPVATGAYEIGSKLLLGQITELVFEARHRAPLTALGYDWSGMAAVRSETDVRLSKDGVDQLLINVKNASTPFDWMLRYGLEPKNVVPLAIYKVLAARKAMRSGACPFLFAFLPDWELRDDVVAMVAREIPAAEVTAATLLANVRGPRYRIAQEGARDGILRKVGTMAVKRANIGADFVVIGPIRALNILVENFDTRAPALQLRGGMKTQPGVHVLIDKEMTPWSVVMDHLRRGPAGQADLAREVGSGNI
jgi:hypothetical protein